MSKKKFICRIGLHRFYIIRAGAATELIGCKHCNITRVVPTGWPLW